MAASPDLRRFAGLLQRLLQQGSTYAGEGQCTSCTEQLLWYASWLHLTHHDPKLLSNPPYALFTCRD